MIEIRKLNAAKQTHTTDNGRAVIEEHGYRVRITIDLDYNRLNNRQIPHRHKAIQELLDSALTTAAELRGTTGALIDIDDLELPLDIGDHA